MALLAALVVVAGVTYLPAHHPAPARRAPGVDRSANAVWLGVEWVDEPHEAEEIAALAEGLAGLEVRYVFAYTSYLKPGGRFNPTYAQAGDFVRALKAAQPSLSVQAWIGLPLGAGADLRDPAARQRVAGFCGELVSQYRFDGVHLDPEPVADGDPGVLALLEEVRAAIGEGAALSIAAPRMCPILAENPPPLLGRHCWSTGYYREVAGRVDQLAVMTYDSILPLPGLYRRWVHRQVVGVSRAVDGAGAALLIGVPTSEERTWTHRPAAENMQSGLQGVLDGLSDPAARPEVVVGVAIYPYWETDAAEWEVYRSLWLGQ